ncbi:hypothetical protein PYW08_009921 [Mythimna loreyi]|uniref:Uncharacterized protein n=1 Tax=Mythimna loreyi TaxID=667449 RepID=A0ACC2Q548_9NEOP|nr:hypothetical protein PYW08_009921 [Mythimna loreyi]
MHLTNLTVLLTLLVIVTCCDSIYVYSSFWAPLFDRRILNYRVDATFHPDHATSAREQYTKDYGFRGEKLIAQLGNGKGPADVTRDVKTYGGVKFYYT